MAISTRLCSLLAFCWLPALVWSRIGDLAYPIIERSLQTQQISVEDLEEFMLTYSYNSPPKVLEKFWIDLYETDGWLPTDSKETIGQALSQFLVAEMNARYSNDQVKELEVSFSSQSTITSSRRKWRRGLQTIGSELQTQLTVTFRNEPSPDKDAVEDTVSTVMSNLTMFIGNLTELGAGDPELANINRAERKETGGFGGEDTGDDDFIPPRVDGATGPDQPTTEQGMPFAVVMIVVGSALALLSSAAVYAVRSRRRSIKVDEVQQPGLGQINVFLGDDDEDDIFSFEAALIESPAVSAISRFSASANSQSQVSSEGSDVFASIESQLTSPRESTSVFSGLSGQKSAGSSSTVPISNLTKDLENRIYPKPPTPQNKLASLLTFSEEEEEETESEESNEGAPLVPGTILKPPKKLPKKQTASETSKPATQSETTKVVGVVKVSFAHDNDTATHYAADGPTPLTAHSASTNTTETTQPRAPLSPSSSVSPPAESFHPRWDDATFPSYKEHTSPIKKAGFAEAGIKSSMSVESSSPRHEDNPYWHTADSGAGFSPSQASDGGGSAGSHEVKLQWNNPDAADTNAAKAAQFVRAFKATSPEKSAVIKSPVYRHSPKTPKSPRTPRSSQMSPAGSPGFSPGGRRKSQKGRRHAKSTSADGSRNYQHETMQQKDESLASFDAVSLSDSDASARHVQTPKTSKSTVTTPSEDNKSFFSLSSEASSSSDGSASKRLLNDLVWLEKKIAGAAKHSSGAELTDSEAGTPMHRKIEQMDSLSFASNEEASINTASPHDRDHEKPRGVSAIVCRDCFAPPGKLRIVIHSTKDGPAIHTVKAGSSLTGHVFPGDLIISVDDVDTRSYTAEQVMKMMTARNKYQRKITVLHFESETK